MHAPDSKPGFAGGSADRHIPRLVTRPVSGLVKFAGGSRNVYFREQSSGDR